MNALIEKICEALLGGEQGMFNQRDHDAFSHTVDYEHYANWPSQYDEPRLPQQQDEDERLEHLRDLYRH